MALVLDPSALRSCCSGRTIWSLVAVACHDHERGRRRAEGAAARRASPAGRFTPASGCVTGWRKRSWKAQTPTVMAGRAASR